MSGPFRFTILVILGLLALPACGTTNKTPHAKQTLNSPATPVAASSDCPPPDLIATQPIRNLNLSAERGPSPDLGSQSDTIWTWPNPEIAPGRSIAVELNRGESHPYGHSQLNGRPVTVRGFPATIDEIEDGYGILWNEGTKDCDHYSLAAYGMGEDEALQFANGLRNAD